MLCADTLDTDTALNINDEQAVSAVALKMHVLQVSRRSVSHRNRCFGGQHQLGLRMKEISALLEPAGCGDLIQKQKSTEANETELMGIIEALNKDPLSAHIRSMRASRYVLKDEAAVKMMIKSKSPNIGHDSTAHRIDLDWLLDRLLAETQKHSHITTRTTTRRRKHHARNKWALCC